MRICVLGNSQAASIRFGWDLLVDEYKDISLTIFARHWNSLNGLFVQNGRLLPNKEKLADAMRLTSGGLDVVDPVEYDIFLLYGMDARANFVFTQRYYSAQVQQKNLEDLKMSTKSTMSYGLLMKLREITDKPIFIGHNPLIASQEIKFEGKTGSYRAGIDELNREFYCRYNATLVPQPESTIVNGNQTHSKHSRLAPRVLGNGNDLLYNETDRAHMNAQFGALWLKNFLNRKHNRYAI